MSTVSLKGDICIGHLSCVLSGSLLPEETPLRSHHPMSSWWWCSSPQTSYCKTPCCFGIVCRKKQVQFPGSQITLNRKQRSGSWQNLSEYYRLLQHTKKIMVVLTFKLMNIKSLVRLFDFS